MPRDRSRRAQISGPREDRVEAVTKLLKGFLLDHRQTASVARNSSRRARRAQQAAAGLSRRRTDPAGSGTSREDFTGSIRFPRSDLPRTELKEFADAFAQMLAYGLFLARLNRPNEKSRFITRATCPRRFSSDPRAGRFPRGAGQTRIPRRALGRRGGTLHRQRPGSRRQSTRTFVPPPQGDQPKGACQATRRNTAFLSAIPFIYFYEDYLKAYDKETRRAAASITRRRPS